MKIARTVLAAATLVAVSAPAHAVTIATYFTPGQSATQATVFQSFTTNAPNSTVFTPGAGESASIGANLRTYQTGQSGEAVAPVTTPSTGSFLSILGGSYTVALTGAQVFSFIFASLDNYNSVTLNFASGASTTLFGGQIVTGLTSTDVNSFGAATGRVTYDIGGTDVFTSAVFSSSTPAFEIDELASAAPEPAAWALMILGFGIVGSALRRRRSKVRFNFA